MKVKARVEKLVGLSKISYDTEFKGVVYCTMKVPKGVEVVGKGANGALAFENAIQRLEAYEQLRESLKGDGVLGNPFIPPKPKTFYGKKRAEAVAILMRDLKPKDDKKEVNLYQEALELSAKVAKLSSNSYGKTTNGYVTFKMCYSEGTIQTCGKTADEALHNALEKLYDACYYVIATN